MIRDGLLCLLIAAAAWISIELVSCTARTESPTTVAQQVQVIPAAKAEATVDDLLAQLAAAREHERQSIKREREDHDRAVLQWIDGLALVGVALCAVGAFLLPALRLRLAEAGFGCAAVLLLSSLLSALVPWLPWIGLGLVAIAGLIGLTHVKNLHRAMVDMRNAVWKESTKKLLQKVQSHA